MSFVRGPGTSDQERTKHQEQRTKDVQVVVTPRCASTFAALWLATALLPRTAAVQHQHLARLVDSRLLRLGEVEATERLHLAVGGPRLFDAIQHPGDAGLCAEPEAAVRAGRQQHRARLDASRISMACEYAIEAYGPDADRLPRIVDEAFDRGRSLR